MKTLLLAPQPYFSYRGTPLNVRTMLKVLSGAGVPVDLLTYPIGEDTPFEGLTIRRLGGPPGLRGVAIGFSPAKLVLGAEMAVTAYAMARRGGYAMVHALEESVYVGLLLKKIFGLPLLYDMDSSMAEQMSAKPWASGPAVGRLLARLEAAAVRGSDGVLSVCAALTETARRAAPGKPVFQIEDIPHEAGERRDPPDAPLLAKAFAGKRIILYTGNFEPYQGVDLLVEAMPLVAAAHPEALLVMVGGGGRRLDEVRDKVRRLGLDGAVLLVEPRPMPQMDWFMERAYALVSPRTGGTNTPLKIYTYMKSGRPVAATRRPTHTQVLDDACAALTEPTPRGMAEGIVGLLDDPARAERLGLGGRRLVEERYSLDGFRAKLLSAYASVGGYRFPGVRP